MKNLKPIIYIFSWALFLELISISYFLATNKRTLEFYMDVFLIIFTVIVLIIFIIKAKKSISKK